MLSDQSVSVGSPDVVRPDGRREELGVGFSSGSLLLERNEKSSGEVSACMDAEYRTL